MKKLTILLCCLAFGTITYAQFDPGNAQKLIATGLSSTTPIVGLSSAISSDGTTLITGAPYEHSHIGAAVVFRKSAGGCYYQEAILNPSNNQNKSLFGSSVALSADGNIAAVGGDSDALGLGAVWIFTRSNGQWTQQAKLRGGDYSGYAQQGYSVSLSGDGETLLFGGPNDNYNTSARLAVGASWYFQFVNNAWKQISTKITSSGKNFALPFQGYSVALSGDGKTAIVGAPYALDNGANTGFTTGGATIYSLSTDWNYVSDVAGADYNFQNFYIGFSVTINNDGTVAILAAPGANSGQGTAYAFNPGSSHLEELQTPSQPIATQKGNSVGISGDGKTAIIGDVANGNPGTSWLLTSSGGVWQRVGSVKGFIGPNPKQNSQQGYSVAISKDGSTFVSGGPSDDNGKGAVWLFPNNAIHVTNPVITDFNPKSAIAGDKITITGTNLMAVNQVFFGGVEATKINRISDNTLEAWVAAGSASGDVQAITLCGDATKSGFVYTGASAVQNADDGNAFGAKLYPNPATDYLTVDFAKALGEPATLTIIDQIGRAVSISHIEGNLNTCRLAVGALPKGCYILRLQSITKGSGNYLFIKN